MDDSGVLSGQISVLEVGLGQFWAGLDGQRLGVLGHMDLEINLVHCLEVAFCTAENSVRRLDGMLVSHVDLQ